LRICEIGALIGGCPPISLTVVDVPKPTRLRPIPAVVLLIASLALLLSACSSGGGKPKGTVTVTGGNGNASSGSSSGSSSAAPTTPAATPVHIKTLNSDGVTYGVGMPVIAYFSKKLTSAKELQAKTTATVNGKPIKGAWYFEYSSANKGYPVEGHFRPQVYWPAHSKIHIGIPMKGVSAGKGLAFDNSLTLDFSIGPRNITTVDDSNNTVTFVSDGRKMGTFKTSLGDPKGRGGNKRTKSGIKVIMEKGRDISMRGPGYFDPHIKFTQRLTYDGEYLHAAPWNISNINRGINTSNGCTNLLPKDAQRLYGLLRIGDVVTYPNADGPRMQLGQGYGDWNVSWSEWQTGGLVSTS